MEPSKLPTEETDQSNETRGFRTMEIQTRRQNMPNQPFMMYPQNPFMQYPYFHLANLIFGFVKTESNKKFYKNEVLKMPMTQVTGYEDINKVKNHFPSCANVNNLTKNFSNLPRGEFFILRSTCDDDIHKAIKYGIWTSTNYTNHILNNRFRECQRAGVPIYLIFT